MESYSVRALFDEFLLRFYAMQLCSSLKLAKYFFSLNYANYLLKIVLLRVLEGLT